jgi:hypothetical protein
MTADAIGSPPIRTRAYMSASSGPGSPSPRSRIFSTFRTTNFVCAWSGWLDGTGASWPGGFRSATRVISFSNRERYSVRPFSWPTTDPHFVWK